MTEKEPTIDQIKQAMFDTCKRVESDEGITLVQNFQNMAESVHALIHATDHILAKAKELK